MNLYFVRHGYADSSYPDEERNLTENGIEILERSILSWKHHISEIDYIISSPLNRAYQTASIIADKFDVPNEIIVEKELAIGGGLNKISPLITALESDNTLLVGHMPDIAMMSYELLSATTLNLMVNPGTIIGIEVSNRLTHGNLKFFIPPVI